MLQAVIGVAAPPVPHGVNRVSAGGKRSLRLNPVRENARIRYTAFCINITFAGRLSCLQNVLVGSNNSPEPTHAQQYESLHANIIDAEPCFMYRKLSQRPVVNNVPAVLEVNRDSKHVWVGRLQGDSVPELDKIE